jgi:hypothetical protein
MNRMNMAPSAQQSMEMAASALAMEALYKDRSSSGRWDGYMNKNMAASVTELVKQYRYPNRVSPYIMSLYRSSNTFCSSEDEDNNVGRRARLRGGGRRKPTERDQDASSAPGSGAQQGGPARRCERGEGGQGECTRAR